jgi:hypothetical protein
MLIKRVVMKLNDVVIKEYYTTNIDISRLTPYLDEIIGDHTKNTGPKCDI